MCTRRIVERIAALVCLLILAAQPGCSTKTLIEITAPPRGAMLAKGSPVQLTIKAPGSEVLVNGTSVSGDDLFTTSLAPAPAPGVGFAVVARPDDPMVAVRSWHQGEYRASSAIHSSTMTLYLGADALGGKPWSLGPRVASILQGAELAAFVKNPLKVTRTVIVVPVTVTVTVTSAVSPQVGLNLKLTAGVLSLEADLKGLVAKYDATSSGFSSKGSVTYDSVGVTGKIRLNGLEASTADLVVTLSKGRISDSGGLPGELVAPLVEAFDKEIKDAVAAAARKAVEVIFGAFISNNKPSIGLTFNEPVVQETEVEGASLGHHFMEATLKTRVSAKTPKVAGKAGGVVKGAACRPDPGPALTAVVGSDLLNQIAYAAWDAGNLTGLVYTKEQLEALGMPKLGFPYDQMRSATVSLLLPPLLVWDEKGPWLSLGGVQIGVSASISGSMTAWTAMSVPVKLIRKEQVLRLAVDPARATTIKEVEFDEVSDFASRDKILELLRAAVPGALAEVFGKLPVLAMPSFTLPRLDGSAGASVKLQIESVGINRDCWQIGMILGDS